MVDEVLLGALGADVALQREFLGDDLLDGDLLVPAVPAVALVAARLGDKARVVPMDGYHFSNKVLRELSDLCAGPLNDPGLALKMLGELFASEPDSGSREKIEELAARVNDFEAALLIVLVLGLCIRQLVSDTNANGLLAISTTLFGLMYVPWLLNFIQAINFFPGIGGILDLLDSLLFNAPIMYLYLRHVLTHP